MRVGNVRPRTAAFGRDDEDFASDGDEEHETGSQDGAPESTSESIEHDDEDEDENDDDDEGDAYADDDDDDDDDDDEGEEAEAVQEQIRNVSFGALKAAQDSLSLKKRKRGVDAAAEQDEKLARLRERLRQIEKDKNSTGTSKAAAAAAPTASRRNNAPAPTTRPARATRDDDDDDDDDDDENDSALSDSAPSEEGNPSLRLSRSSKHAPTAMSSKRPVTRKRQIVSQARSTTRDPRFDAVHASSQHSAQAERAYSFLAEYQASELAEVRAALGRSKDASEREALRRAAERLSNKLSARAAKQRERDVVAAHRSEERAAVRAGAKQKPFFLKRSEVRDRALAEKFRGLSGKERERAMERRRRKEGQKEKKRMPGQRRRGGGGGGGGGE